MHGCHDGAIQSRCADDCATSDVEINTQRTVVEFGATEVLSSTTEWPWGLLLSDKRHALCLSNKQRITIGRSHECDIVLDDPRISAVHFAIILSVEVSVPSTSRERCRCHNGSGAGFCKGHSQQQNAMASRESPGCRTSCFTDHAENEFMCFQETLCHSVSNSKVYLEDMSSNGTYVNGTMVGRGRRCQLHSGDDIGVVSFFADSLCDQKEGKVFGISKNNSPMTAANETRALVGTPKIRSYVEIFCFQAYNSVTPSFVMSDAVTVSVLAEQGSPQKEQKWLGPSIKKDEVGASQQFIPVSFRFRRLQRGRPIGFGSSSAVYAGIDLDTGRMVALKVLRHNDTFSLSSSASNRGCSKSPCHPEACSAELKDDMQECLNDPDESLRELHFLMRLEHHRIVQCLGVQRVPEGLCLVLEYVAGGTLQDLIKNFGAFHEHIIRLYTLQVLQGMEYLQACGVVHGDLKSANVLISERGDIKISDFGTSRFVQGICAYNYNSQEGDENGVFFLPYGSEKKLSGTPIYMSPELIWTQQSTFSSDVWALGCMVYEMAVGVPPWEELHGLLPLSVVWSIGNATTGPCLDRVRERGGSLALLNFLESTFQLDLNQRPTVAELLKHPFIAGHTRMAWTPPVAVFPSTPPTWGRCASLPGVQPPVAPFNVKAPNHGDFSPSENVSDTHDDNILLSSDDGNVVQMDVRRPLPPPTDLPLLENEGLLALSPPNHDSEINYHKAFAYELRRKKVIWEEDSG